MTNNTNRKIIFLTSNHKFLNHEILNTHVAIAIVEGDKVINRFIAVVRKHTYDHYNIMPDFVINNEEVIVRSIQEKYVCFNRETEYFISDIIDGKVLDNTKPKAFSVYDVNSRDLDVLFNRFEDLKASAIVDDEKEKIRKLDEEIKKSAEEIEKLRKDLNDANDCINSFKKSLISAFMSILDVNDKSFAYELLGVKEANTNAETPSVNILNVNTTADEDAAFVEKARNHIIAVVQKRELPNNVIIKAVVDRLNKSSLESITYTYISEELGLTRHYALRFCEMAEKGGFGLRRPNRRHYPTKKKNNSASAKKSAATRKKNADAKKELINKTLEGGLNV